MNLLFLNDAEEDGAWVEVIWGLQSRVHIVRLDGGGCVWEVNLMRCRKVEQVVNETHTH